MKLIELLNIAADPQHNPKYLAEKTKEYIDKFAMMLVHPDIDEAVSAEIQMAKEQRQ